MFDLSDDDSFSTQLEGKKLKNRGARLKGSSAYKSGHLLEIEKDAPGLMEQVEIEEGQEFFTERKLEPESKREREERLKKELNAARLQQLQLQKQQQRQQQLGAESSRTPNERLGEIEQGMLQSRNKGRPTVSTQFKQHNQPLEELQALERSQQRKTDVPAAKVLLGDNVKNMDVAEHKEQDKSIPAKILPDIRSGNKEPLLGF